MVRYVYMRATQFFTNGYYHIYNRGVDKRIVFQRFGHYLRFLTTIRSILKTGSATQRSIYNQGLALSTKIDILAYCLMPNHYHFLIKQTHESGITEFMQKLDTSYTMYFNLNNKRTGHLFEYAFKAKTIESDDVLLHVSRYIHLNPVIARLVETPEQWRWSSYKEYIDNESPSLCNTKEILGHFASQDDYPKFTNDQIAYAMLLKETEDVKDEDLLFF